MLPAYFITSAIGLVLALLGQTLGRDEHPRLLRDCNLPIVYAEPCAFSMCAAEHFVDE